MARARRTTQDATVSGQYADGEGWEIGNRAPSIKYRDVDGNIVDEQPEDGGWIVAQKGDTITPAMYAELNRDEQLSTPAEPDEGTDDSTPGE